MNNNPDNKNKYRLKIIKSINNNNYNKINSYLKKFNRFASNTHLEKIIGMIDGFEKKFIDSNIITNSNTNLPI